MGCANADVASRQARPVKDGGWLMLFSTGLPPRLVPERSPMRNVFQYLRPNEGDQEAAGHDQNDPDDGKQSEPPSGITEDKTDDCRGQKTKTGVQHSIRKNRQVEFASIPRVFSVRVPLSCFHGSIPLRMFFRKKLASILVRPAGIVFALHSLPNPDGDATPDQRAYFLVVRILQIDPDRFACDQGQSGSDANAEDRHDDSFRKGRIGPDELLDRIGGNRFGLIGLVRARLVGTGW